MLHIHRYVIAELRELERKILTERKEMTYDYKYPDHARENMKRQVQDIRRAIGVLAVDQRKER